MLLFVSRMLTMFDSNATEGSILLAVVTVAFLALLMIEWAHSSLKKALTEQLKTILKRLDAVEGVTDQILREIGKLDAKLPNSSTAKVTGPDESEEIFKDGWLATPAQHRRRDEGLKSRELGGKRALAIHGDLIAKAKRLCAKEGIECDEFGCPEPYRTWIHDDSPTSNAKFEAAKRVAEAYRPILLDALRNGIGDELMSKLGEPEEYQYPQAGPGHGEVLAYCSLEFKHVDKGLFDGLPVPENSEPDNRNVGIILDDRNVEVSHTAGFGILDPGFGEQYIPGDLRVIVGVKTVDEMTSYYTGWRYQVNPTANNFLKAQSLFGLRCDPNADSERDE